MGSPRGAAVSRHNLSTGLVDGVIQQVHPFARARFFPCILDIPTDCPAVY